MYERAPLKTEHRFSLTMWDRQTVIFNSNDKSNEFFARSSGATEAWGKLAVVHESPEPEQNVSVAALCNSQSVAPVAQPLLGRQLVGAQCLPSS